MVAEIRLFSVSPRIRLAACAPFRLGAAEVRPAVREVSGPGGCETLEPRIMQVLVALADAEGEVVSRDVLVERCWDGRIVGDDAIVRVISRLRRLSEGAAAGSFAIDTVPKVGYRLRALSALTAPDAAADGEKGSPPVKASRRTTRRGLIVGGAAAALVAAAAGGAAWLSGPHDPQAAEADRLMAQGAQAMREGLPELDAQGVGFFREAARLRPDDPRAWGRLALAYAATAEYARGEAERAALMRAGLAARRALALDPRQGDALAAVAQAPPVYGRWAAAESDFRRVLAIDPANMAATENLGRVMMSVGRTRETETLVQTSAGLDPLSPIYQFELIYTRWTAGAVEEAGRVAARARELWPLHPSVWWATWLYLAFTERAGEARAMAEDRRLHPRGLTKGRAQLLALSGAALETRNPVLIARATVANAAAARRGAGGAITAIQLLSGLGALDQAFAACEGYLLRSGAPAPAEAEPDGFPLNDHRKKKTMMLFVPSCAALRADPRFGRLCEAMGLAAYWRAKGLRFDGARAV